MTSSERAKDLRLRRIFKTTLEKQNEQKAKQNNCCAICTRNFDEFTAFQDHLHKCCPRRLKEFCGKCNRGLLCYPCNKFVTGVIERQSLNKELVDPIIFVTSVLAYFTYWKPILEARGAYEEKEIPAVCKKKTRVRRNSSRVSKR